MRQTSFTRILGILSSVLDAYSAVLFLKENNSENSEHRLAAFFSLGDKIAPGTQVQPGKGLVGWIIRNGEPLLVPNFDQRQNHLGYYRDNEEQRIKAFMGCVLPDGRGALCVDSKRQYSFSDKDQKLLHLFAGLLAELSSSGELEEKQLSILRYHAALKTVYTLRREHSLWGEFLRQFLALMAATCGCSYAVFCVTGPSGETYQVEGENSPLLTKGKNSSEFSLTSGVIGWVFRNDAPLFSGGPGGIPEASLFGKAVSTPHFQSVMALPLIIQRKTRGVLCIAHDTPIPLTEELKEFAGMASEHLALFLENLYVKCRLRDVFEDMARVAEQPDS
jgi:signal transduction protein with GAF and PtsI domain